MASLRIPERYKGGLTKLINLSSEDAQKVASVLEGIPVTSTLRETLVENLSTIDIIPQSDVAEIVDTLSSLYTVVAYKNEPPGEVADDIAEALEESDEELRFPDEIRERLTQLLSLDPLVVSAKADGQMYEYENIFSTARILTDIRPIFGLNSEEPPKAGVITHMLSIHYYHGGQHKELNIALDEVDIDELMDALVRAGSKAETLKSVLELAKLTYLEP